MSKINLLPLLAFVVLAACTSSRVTVKNWCIQYKQNHLNLLLLKHWRMSTVN